MALPLSSEDKDRLYNFTCPGCRMRRNKRAARMIGSSAPWAAGVQVMYCKACAAEIGEGQPLPKSRGRDIDQLEKRWKVDLEAMVKERRDSER